MTNWHPIRTAPKSKKIAIDLWSKHHGRCTNYFRYKKDMFCPIKGGISVITDATHWIPIPEKQEDV